MSSPMCNQHNFVHINAFPFGAGMHIMVSNCALHQAIPFNTIFILGLSQMCIKAAQIFLLSLRYRKTCAAKWKLCDIIPHCPIYTVFNAYIGKGEDSQYPSPSGIGIHCWMPCPVYSFRYPSCYACWIKKHRRYPVNWCGFHKNWRLPLNGIRTCVQLFGLKSMTRGIFPFLQKPFTFASTKFGLEQSAALHGDRNIRPTPTDVDDNHQPRSF